MTSPDYWRYWGRWQDNVFSCSLWYAFCESDAYNKLMSSKILTGDMLAIDGHLFTPEQDFSKACPHVIASLSGKDKWFRNLFLNAKKEITKLRKLENKKDIAVLLYCLREIYSVAMLVHMSDRCLEPYLRRKTADDYIPYEKILSLIRPARETPLMKYNRELRSHAPRNYKSFIKKYAWIGTHAFMGTPLTRARLRGELKNIKRRDIFTSPPKQISGGLKKIIKIASELAFWRSSLVETADKVFYSYHQHFESLAKKFDLSIDDLKLLTFYEILHILKTGRIAKQFKKRKDKWGISVINGKWKIFTGRQAEAKLKKFLPSTQTKLTEVKGVSAYRGRVRGTVKVLREPKDIFEVRDGDIIVASETTPDCVVAMRKAAAFVTDMGGITSHAAIIARELRKPCIIGTQIATQVFKDGDVVEVDATRSVVRKIK